MVRKLNGYLLPKKVRHNFLVKVRPFSGAKVSCMVDHVKPTIRNDKPDHVILEQIICILEQMIFVMRKEQVKLPDLLLN